MSDPLDRAAAAWLELLDDDTLTPAERLARFHGRAAQDRAGDEDTGAPHDASECGLELPSVAAGRAPVPVLGHRS